MKKITDYVVGYITHETDLHHPITVVATFFRILAYFTCFGVIFIQHEFLLGFILLGITICTTLVALLDYLRGLYIDESINYLERAKTEYRQLKSEEREDIMTSFKSLPKEEQIRVLESYIEVCEEAKLEAEMLLEQVKHEDES